MHVKSSKLEAHKDKKTVSVIFCTFLSAPSLLMSPLFTSVRTFCTGLLTMHLLAPSETVRATRTMHQRPSIQTFVWSCPRTSEDAASLSCGPLLPPTSQRGSRTTWWRRLRLDGMCTAATLIYTTNTLHRSGLLLPLVPLLEEAAAREVGARMECRRLE